MVPPASLLEELDRLEHDNLTPSDHELRRWSRLSVRGEAELYPMDRSRLDCSPVEITLRDVSRHGMGFLSNQDLRPDSCWRCCFLKAGHVIGQQALSVRHCSAVREGIYLVGAQFVVDSGLLLLLGIDPARAQGE